MTKRFPGVTALDGVDFELHSGEILAVVGENGAGKSTLMKVLAGVHRPDEGGLEFDGAPALFRTPREALDAGMALIHQELNLADNLSAAANLFLGREPRRGFRIDHAQILRRSRELLAGLGAEFDPLTPVSRLSMGQRQQVEIAKALAANASVLILDEPTSSLSDRETERLMELCERLRAGGTSLVYISHRLGEVERLADRVLVLRDGAVAGELEREGIDHDTMVRLMVGRDVAQLWERNGESPGNVVFAVSDLRTTSDPEHAIELKLRAGEIVALAGLLGSGRTELLEALYGIEPPLTGKVEVRGNQASSQTPAGSLAAGIGLVPEERKVQGLVLEFSIAANLSLATLAERGARFGVQRLDHQEEERRAREAVANLGVRCSGVHQPVGLLSGGNQQKVSIGRILERSPAVLLLDEPTRGVDIGARHELYAWLEAWVKEGGAILFASSEMEEILGLADRVLVMREGRLSGELVRSEFSEEAILQLATAPKASTSFEGGVHA